jgi:biotin carboxyl carrier protein
VAAVSDGRAAAAGEPAGGWVADPRSVRVSLGPGSAGVDVPPAVISPAGPSDASGDRVLVDGEPVVVALTPAGAGRAVLRTTSGGVVERRAILLSAPAPATDRAGAVEREVVVDGWRVVVRVESERRAGLRERATRGGAAAAHSGPTEIRAIIPGRVLSVLVALGDRVEAGRQLLVVEAMKMQNELRAPREGTVARVAVAPGQTIEVGDLLAVLE